MIRLWAAWVLGSCLLGVALLGLPMPVRADCLKAGAAESQIQALLRSQLPQYSSPSAFINALSKANVVYLGETHDRPEDHQAQRAIIQTLHCLNPRLAIGLEMFQRPYQPLLDQYQAGKLTEAELQEKSQYKKRWGFSWEFYAPILRFAKEKNLPLIALNTPAEVTRKVSRTGLDSLTPTDRQFIPPRSAIVLGPDTYRQRIREIYDEIHQGKTGSRNFEYFFQAQVLWDETMAERIAQTLQQKPDRPIVVLVGQGHLFYGDGLPDRVARRLCSDRPRFTQASVLLSPPEDLREQNGNVVQPCT